MLAAIINPNGLVGEETRFRQEPLSEALFYDMIPLFAEHYKEIAHFKDIKLEPDYIGYQAVDIAGKLRVYTMRVGGSLEGYGVYMVGRNMHYKSSIQATQDILYISPQYRRGHVGIKFIKWCDEQLKAEGVQAVYQHVKQSHNFGLVLERMGYRLVDLIYTRRLD